MASIAEIAPTDEMAEKIKTTKIANMAHMTQKTKTVTKVIDLAYQIEFKEKGETTAMSKMA